MKLIKFPVIPKEETFIDKLMHIAESIPLNGFDREMLRDNFKRKQFRKALEEIDSLFVSRLDKESACRVLAKTFERLGEDMIRELKEVDNG